MLVMFKFKNYGSFKEEAVFDMRAIKSYKEHPYNLITECNTCNLLKVVAIYGANASGKSTFVEAYHTFLNIVKHSFKMNNKEDEHSVLERNYFPFIFDDDSLNNDTEFEAVFHLNGFEYKYGFTYNNKRIHYEWLYRKSLTTNRISKIFERSPDRIELGSSIVRVCEKYLQDISVDVLALSFFSSLKLRTHVFQDAIFCMLAILPLSLSSDGRAEHMMKLYFEKEFNEEEKPNLLKFLNAIDVGIKDIEVEKNKNAIQVYTSHTDSNGELFPIPIELESDGTKRAIAVYAYIRIAVLQGKGLIIDEFNNQLHPLLQKYLIDLFYENSTVGQLIYTTHDTSLMDKQFMRRDQIWFVSKNSRGESSIYSLAEFKVRTDKSSLKNDYLSGVYGAIPILKEFSFKENE